ncbi:hypothetical protein M5K25_016949 [Dendrobium thyrsiflorum]|uniref:Uncharacterized protein n=1 Tax=Dendrobium thyrsiflorum TaxID=117978 RepID=A0ABD0ULG2_DENTH
MVSESKKVRRLSYYWDGEIKNVSMDSLLSLDSFGSCNSSCIGCFIRSSNSFVYSFINPWHMISLFCCCPCFLEIWKMLMHLNSIEYSGMDVNFAFFVVEIRIFKPNKDSGTYAGKKG